MATIEQGKTIEGSGTGTPLRYPGVPVSGATFNGVAARGALCNDTLNGQLYQNTGTQAATVWTKVGTEV